MDRFRWETLLIPIALFVLGWWFSHGDFPYAVEDAFHRSGDILAARHLLVLAALLAMILGIVASGRNR